MDGITLKVGEHFLLLNLGVVRVVLQVAFLDITNDNTFPDVMHTFSFVILSGLKLSLVYQLVSGCDSNRFCSHPLSNQHGGFLAKKKK